MGSCNQCCHGQERWKPATLDHDKLFVLDRDHDGECATCHRNNEFSRYTCYGYHEHSPAKVRAEHVKEGIPVFENCMECHRDPGVEPKKQGQGRTDRKHEKD